MPPTHPTTPLACIGLGTVARGVAALLHEHADAYARLAGTRPVLAHILVRDAAKARAYLADTGHADPEGVTDDPDDFFAALLRDDTPVVLELAGGGSDSPAGAHVRRALRAGRHVVTANKALLAQTGPELFALAHDYDAALAFEASCGGGIPCVEALTGGLAGNAVHGLFGILNGTCNFILTRMTQHGSTFDDALADAKAQGFAEADSTLDVTGVDAAQKLAILSSLAFSRDVPADAVHAQGIEDLSLVDIAAGRELGYDVKLLAIAERDPLDPQARIAFAVEPCFLKTTDLLAQVRGPFNALSVVGDAAGHVFLYGQGAGQMPTASAVVGDLLALLSGRYAPAFATAGWTPDRHPPADPLPHRDATARFYLRVQALDEPGVMAQLCAALGNRGIGISAVSQHETDETLHDGRRYTPVVLITDPAPRGDMLDAIADLQALDTTHDAPHLIRIVDLP